MPVSHEHLAGTVQTWNGVTFAIMAKAEAKKLEAEGKIQITTNLQSRDLKPADAFRKRAKRNKKTYETREMKAHD
jgi:hypothetical protein